MLLAGDGLDPSFGVDGRILTDVGRLGSSGYGQDVVAVQGDGEIKGFEIGDLGHGLGLADSVAAVDNVFADGAVTASASATDDQSAGDDHGNNAGTATPITVPSVIAGEIEEGGDTDWFRFTALAGAQYVFETTLGSVPDTKLALYAADGTTQLAEDDDSGESFASRIEWTASDSGTHYLEVTAFRSFHTGTYTLDVSGSGGDDHGNNAGTATPITVPSVNSGSLEEGGDVDWFQFPAVAGAQYVFETTLGTLADSKLALYASNGTTQLVEDDDSGEGLASRIEWTAPTSGTHYLAVTGFRSSHFGTYTLNVSAIGVDDHGDNAATATPITAPSVTPGNLEEGGDKDWFRFTAVAGVQYVFETTLGSLNDSRLALYASNGTTQLDADDDSGPGSASRIQWTAPTSGTHYLEVTAFTSSDIGTYTLDVSVIGVVDDHGDEAATATPIAVPSVTPGNLEEGGDKDWFRFTAVAGAQYVFETTLGTLNDSRLALYATNGTTQLDADDDSGAGAASRIEWTAPTSGTHYLEVTAFRSSDVGTYTLEVSVFGLVDDHGDNAATATPITAPSVIAGNLEVGGDTDWFQFTAVAGVQYLFETTLVSLPDSKLVLYAGNGTTQLDVDDNSGEGLASRIQWTASTSGTHYLEVTALNNSDVGLYTLDVSASDGDDHGNSAGTATPITIPSVTPGNLEKGGDADWFQFIAVADTHYIIETTLDSLPDPQLALYAADGTTLLDEDDDSGGGADSRIRWTAPTSGTHYLEVTAFNDSDTGTYSLVIAEGAEDDHGNNAATATPIAVSSATPGEIDEGEDTDWFVFTAVAGSHYVFSTTLDTLDDSKLALYAADGTTLLEAVDDSDGGTQSRIEWTAPTSGTHYLEVTAFTSFQTGTYTLGVSSCVGVGPGVLTLNVHQTIMQENDGSSLATVSRSGTSGDLSVNLISNDTTEAVVPSSVTIPDGFNSVTFDVTAADDSIADGTQTVTITATADGHISGTDTIFLTDDETVGDNHGDNAGTASPITVPSITPGDLEVGRDTDWFRFIAVAGTEYVFETTLGSLDDSTLALYAADGTTQLDTDDDGGEGFASRIEWMAPTSGTHYLEIKSFSSESGTYTLDVSVGGGDDHGNDAATATSITVPSGTAGDIDVAGEMDWYRFTAVAGARYVFSTTLFTLEDSRLALYAADGTTQLDVDDDSGDESASRIEWTAPTSGTHYLEVSAFSSLRTGTYTLHVSSCAVVSPGLLTLNVLQTSMQENVGSSLATVSRAGTSGSLLVNLISSDTTEAVVPPSVTIPNGFTSVTFNVTAVDDLIADGTQTVTITASAAGHGSATDTILVTDNETVGDDHGNDAGTATPITVPSVTAGEIEVGGDTDWFQFPAVADIQYVFETTLGSLSDSKLALYATDGTTQLDADDDSGDGRASRIVWTASTSGTHYLEVTAFSGVQTGTYTLDVFGIGGDDHGNNAGTATRITVPSVTPGDLEESGDLDWFQFTAMAGGQYVFETMLGSLEDTILTLYAADGTTQLDADDDSGVGRASRIEWTAPTSGTHYLEVRAFSAVQTGTYTLDVSGPAGGAGLLTLNVLQTSMPENLGSSSASVSRTGTAGSLLVNLISSDTTEAVVPSSVTIPNGSASVTFNVTAVDDLIADGTQTVTITASASGHASATDTILVTDNEFVDDDHGDNAGTATPITAPSVTPGEIEASGDTDWFRFTAVAGTQYLFETTLSSLADSVLALYATNGTTQLDEDDDSGVESGSRIQWTAPSGGAHYLEVTAFRSSQRGTYTLEVSVVGGDDHGNNAATATRITVPSVTPGDLEEGGDSDWFDFTAVAGVRYVFETTLGSLADSKLALYAADGTTLLDEDDDGGERRASRIEWIATTSGRRYLEVTAFSRVQTGTYALDVSSIVASSAGVLTLNPLKTSVSDQL